MKRWFTTVNFPGGEFAMKAETPTEAEDVLVADFNRFRPAGDEPVTIELLRQLCPSLVTRIAPPDLTDWLNGNPPPFPDGELSRAPGGWLAYAAHTVHGRSCSEALCFVPVCGAAGITVIREKEEDISDAED